MCTLSDATDSGYYLFMKSTREKKRQQSQHFSVHNAMVKKVLGHQFKAAPT